MQQTGNNISAVFQKHILNNVRFALQRLPAPAASPPPPKDRELMLTALDYALDSAETWSLTRKLILRLAPKMEQVGYREEWMSYLRRGIDQSKRQKDEAAEAELRLQLGEIYRMMALFPEARTEIEQSLRLFVKIEHTRGRIRALNRLAFLLRQQEELEEARRLAQEALSLVSEGDVEQGYACFVLGNVEMSQRNWKSAAEYYRQALDIWRKTSNPRYLGWAHNNLGNALRELGDYQAAQAHIVQAIEHLRACNDIRNLAIAMMSLGNVFLKQDQ